MKISALMMGTAIALFGLSPALAQLGVGSSAGGAAGAVGGAAIGTPTIPGTMIPDTTADAVRMTREPVAATKADAGAAASAHERATTKKNKHGRHGKHKDSAGASATASGTTDTTAGTGANGGMTGAGATTDTGASAGASAGGTSAGSSVGASVGGGATAGTGTRPSNP